MPNLWCPDDELNSFVCKSLFRTDRCENWTVPKLLHFIWLGSKIPDHFQQNITRWRELNLTWVVKVWSEDDIPEFVMRGRHCFDYCSNFGVKSDILRYEVRIIYFLVWTVDVISQFVDIVSLRWCLRRRWLRMYSVTGCTEQLQLFIFRWFIEQYFNAWN